MKNVSCPRVLHSFCDHSQIAFRSVLKFARSKHLCKHNTDFCKQQRSYYCSSVVCHFSLVSKKNSCTKIYQAENYCTHDERLIEKFCVLNYLNAAFCYIITKIISKVILIIHNILIELIIVVMNYLVMNLRK